MNEPKTITRGAGQARRSAARLILTVAKYTGLTLAKYTGLTLAGIILFRAGAAYALTKRGYSAVGGEAVALLLPVLWYLISQTVRASSQTRKTAICRIIRRTTNHEETC